MPTATIRADTKHFMLTRIKFNFDDRCWRGRMCDAARKRPYSSKIGRERLVQLLSLLTRAGTDLRHLKSAWSLLCDAVTGTYAILWACRMGNGFTRQIKGLSGVAAGRAPHLKLHVNHVYFSRGPSLACNQSFLINSM
eukprot:1877152-Pleurochrysis_carterae.AAC.4